MSRIFISHSSTNNDRAIQLRNWLKENGWDDVYLDLDPERGIAPGENWKKALREAEHRCEAVLALVSPEWLARDWCRAELNTAELLGKKVFVLLIGCKGSDIADSLKDAQYVDLLNDPDAYTRLKVGLKRAGLDAGYFPWPPENDPDRAPYRGLQPLEAEDAGIFFGRDGPTVDGLDQLRELREAPPPRLLVILGASGGGKSSFLRAGLLPRLAREDQHFIPLPVIRPGRAALTNESSGLVACLEKAPKEAKLRRTRNEIRKAVKSGAASVASLLEELVNANTASRSDDGTKERKPPTLVLAIDQAEELFHAEGVEEAQAFLDLLRGLVCKDAPALIAIFTIRSDSYERLQTVESLQGLRQHMFSLPPMPKGAYAEVIKGPARTLAGTKRALRIEEPLVDALLSDIEEGGAKDALPLLAFALERLYLEQGGDGDLKLSEYEALGRVKGSIEAAVERALKAAADLKIERDRETRLALLRRALIPRLAGIDPDTGTPRRLITRRSEIPSGSLPLIDLLVEQRLLATDLVQETGEITIEPMHEALLRQWGLLHGWLKEDTGALTTLEGIKRAASDWATQGYAPDWLNHAGKRLEDAEKAVGREDLAGDLSADDREYLRQCREHEEATRRAAKNRTTVAVGAAVLLVAAIVWQSWRAELGQDFVKVSDELKRTTQAEQAKKELIRHAASLAEKGNYDGAFAEYDKVLAANPDDPGALDSRAWAYAQKGELAKALTEADRAVMLNQYDPYIMSTRGWIYIEKNQPDLALADFDKALRIDPLFAVFKGMEGRVYGNAGIYAGRGRAYELKGERDKAIADYRNALSQQSRGTYDDRAKAEAAKHLTALGVENVGADRASPQAPPPAKF